jgi:outer membrane immunogenic protein
MRRRHYAWQISIRKRKASNAISGCCMTYSLCQYTEVYQISSRGRRHIAMKRLLVSVVGAAAMAASANAADLSGGGLKDGGYVPVNTWSGFYIGANGGAGWSGHQSSVSAFADDAGITATSPLTAFNTDGGFGGVQVGRNWQYNNLVLGVEADIQWADIKGSGAAHASADGTDVTADAKATNRLDWFSTLRGRAGYGFNNMLVYGTAGIAFGGVKDTLTLIEGGTDGSSGAASTTRSKTEIGVALGGGLEYAFTPAWSLKGEYQYLDLHHLTQAAAVGPDGQGNSSSASSTADHTYHTVRVGINYHLGAGYEPLK